MSSADKQALFSPAHTSPHLTLTALSDPFLLESWSMDAISVVALQSVSVPKHMASRNNQFTKSEAETQEKAWGKHCLLTPVLAPSILSTGPEQWWKGQWLFPGALSLAGKTRSKSDSISENISCNSNGPERLLITQLRVLSTTHLELKREALRFACLRLVPCPYTLPFLLPWLDMEMDATVVSILKKASGKW